MENTETFTIKFYTPVGGLQNSETQKAHYLEKAVQLATGLLRQRGMDGWRAVIEKPDGSTYEYRLNLQMSGGPGLPWR